MQTQEATAEPLPETIPATGEVRGHIIPDDALERLERLVGVLSEPLVIYTAELAAERDEARERAQAAEERANRLVKGLQALVANYPATSWGHANNAKDDAEALLRDIAQDSATMGQTPTPEHGAHPDGKDTQDRPGHRPAG